jgi:flagellar assembly protein FliH
MPLSSKVLKNARVQGVCLYQYERDSRTVFYRDERTADDSPADHRFAELEEDEPQARLLQEQLKQETARLQEETEKLRAALKLEAENEMRRAEKEGYQAGYSKGYDEGLATGRREAAEQCQEMLAGAEKRLLEAHRRSREIVAASEKTIVELAVAVAERLLRSQLEIKPEKVLDLVREALNGLPDGEHIKVYVNPADEPLCRRYQVELAESLQRVETIEVLAEEEIPRGSCRVESESSSVELLLEEDKEKIKELLMELARKEERKLLEEGKALYGEH